MAEHHASVMIDAPVHQVYSLFTHFNDFPKFMRFVKEVTYYDDQRSHWVVQVLGRHEWDAINEDWIEDRQIGWRSINGLQNTGKVKFRPIGPARTIVDVYIRYTPPTGPLGSLGENLGVDSYFDSVLQKDLQHFARMVELAPPGALDPMSSHYLFHSDSAAAKGEITERQKAAMSHDPMMSPEALKEREERLAREAAQRLEEQRRREAERERLAQRALEAAQAHQEALRQAAEKERQERLEREAQRAREAAQLMEAMKKRDPIHHTLGGRNASMERTALGDRDGRWPRHPQYEKDPMIARYPVKNEDAQNTTPLSEEMKSESPWIHSIRGRSLDELAE